MSYSRSQSSSSTFTEARVREVMKPVFDEPPPPPPPVEETKDAEPEKDEPKKITRVSNAPTACSA